MKMERTNVPGIYRRGSKFVITYRDSLGKQRKESFPTFREAKLEKARRQAQIVEGSYTPETHRTFHSYADEWLKRYDGIRENSRKDYEQGIRLAKEFFSPRTKLSQINPAAIAAFIAFLKTHNIGTKEEPKYFLPSSIAKRFVPLRSLFRTAREEGLIHNNPCDKARLPSTETGPTDDDHENDEVKAFSRDELATILEMVDASNHRLLIYLVACTGLRISEALALEWRHIVLSGSNPHVKVRRGVVKGTVGLPKSKHGRRDVPLPQSLVQALRTEAWRSGGGANTLVFPSAAGTYLDAGNLLMRYLKPILEEAGVPWAGFHTFRHTYASLHIARGTNLVALSRALGHHSAAFTLSTYAHLLKGDEAPALDIQDELSTARRVDTEAFASEVGEEFC